MSDLNVRNLAFLRNIPIFGGKLYEALADIQAGVSAVIQQTNANPNGQPEAPPAVQAVRATGQNGTLHVSIEHSAAEVKRGVAYYVEHADNPAFINPQIRNIGDSRSFSEFIGNGTRYVRAYAAYPGSPASAHVYHGDATQPEPVSGGGSIGPPAYLPSQGAGTGAPGQGGMGPGPIPIRTDSSGFDWKLQRPTSTGGFTGGTGSPGSQGSASGSGGSGGGGGLIPTEAIIASCEWLSSVAGTNTITAVTITSYSALAAGFLARLVPANTNTGAVTLNVNGIAAKAVTKNGTTALVAGDLQAARGYFVLYDGTRWQIIGPSFPISATIVASDASGNPTAAALANTKIYIGSVGNLPVAQTVSGDATLAADGTLTLANSGVAAATYGDATHVSQVAVDAKGRVTSASSVLITFPGTSGYNGSVALAKLTIAGTNGSLTVVDGVITAYTAPT